MTMSSLLKIISLAGVLAGHCTGGDTPETPPPSPPTDAGVDAPGPAPVVDAAAPPDTAPVVDVGRVDEAPSAPDVPPPPPPPGPVTVELDSQFAYLLYAYDGGPGCHVGAAGPYYADVTTTAVCVPKSVGAVVSLPIGDIKTCRAGEGTSRECVACENDAACLPSRCFAPLPDANPGTICDGHWLNPGPEGAPRHFVIFNQDKKSDAAFPKQGMPKVIMSSEIEETQITPPPRQATFVIGQLGAPANPNDLPGGSGSECGELNLCGLFPFTFFNSNLSGGWDLQNSGTFTQFFAYSIF